MSLGVFILITCNKCRTLLPDEYFHFRNKEKGLRQRACSTCLNKYAAQYRIKNHTKVLEGLRVSYRKSKLAQSRRPKSWGSIIESRRMWVYELKRNPCTDCNKIYPPFVMDLDHVKGEKKFTIASVMRNSVPDDVLMEEIMKCELVCSNCHRLRTYNRRHLQ